MCIDCSLLAKFFLANSFYFYSSPNFSTAKIFQCTAYISYVMVFCIQCSYDGMAMYMTSVKLFIIFIEKQQILFIE